MPSFCALEDKADAVVMQAPRGNCQIVWDRASETQGNPFSSQRNPRLCFDNTTIDHQVHLSSLQSKSAIYFFHFNCK